MYTSRSFNPKERAPYAPLARSTPLRPLEVGMEQDNKRWFDKRRWRDERRKQDKLWYEEGRKCFQEEFARFEQRYARLGAVLLVVATVLVGGMEFWAGPLLNRLPDQPDDSVLQVFGVPSASGFSFTNGGGGALADCDATIRDSMGTEWQALVPGRVAAHQRILLAWSDFTHQGESINAESARARRVVVSCFVERLHGRRAAMFERETSPWKPDDSRPRAVPGTPP